MNSNQPTKRHTYVITLDERIDPQYLAFHIARHIYLHEHLVSVTDVQSNKRIIGDKYRRPRQAINAGQHKRSFWKAIGEEMVEQIRPS